MILANGKVDRELQLLYVQRADRENLDVSIGRRVARAVGLPHTTLTIGEDFFRRFDRSPATSS